MNEIISGRGEASGENTDNNANAWESMKDVPFNGGEKANAPQISDGEAVAQIFRNMNEARKEALADDDKEKAARLDVDMDILNDAYNRMNEPKNQGKTMVDMFNEMRIEYFQKLDSANSEDEKNALFTKMMSTSDLGSTYGGLKEYIAKQLQNEASETSNETEKSGAVDVGLKIEDLKVDIAKREAALEVLKSYDQRDYGDAVMNATLRLAERKKDFNLLDGMLKRNDYDPNMTGVDAQKILGEMVENRDRILATIDEKIAKTEKGSDEWKKLKAYRREAYRKVSDESVERVLKEVFKV